MDIAVFSDIHANHSALQACFDKAVSLGITHFVLLGDYVSDCPNPGKTMELIYMMKKYFTCYMIRGNREDYLLDYRKKGEKRWKKGSASGALLYTYENLTVKDLNFFDSLPIYDIWKMKGMPSFEYCHGSPTSSRELMLEKGRNTRKIVSHLKTGLLLHGHHHEQESYSYKDKKAVNPGSIGVPWNHGGKTQFAVIRSEGRSWEEEYYALDYDRKEILSEFASSGLSEMAPAWAAVTMHTIRTGLDLNEAVLLRATQLCEQERGEARWPDIPERYFALALKEYRIDLNGKDIPLKK
ncbi:metallophosphoesterase family protein [Butyrivibrio sp. MC2013]|uniref:metallophosphoesterase family protein n=1 Tax=Butyrivibrio sp. MC2013 TaxID=1280686 RepID=UPI0004153CF2|nr:metallophosphoesterase [Butyrivibrio sp. MC2013]